MLHKIRVAVLDDHHSIIDGYKFRLSKDPDIVFVSGISFGEHILPFLSNHYIDVLILDISVPTSPDNPNPYPILHTIPTILQKNPGLHILVISMHNQPGIIQAVMKAGSSGYILKDDRVVISKLAEVIKKIARGSIYISPQAHEKMSQQIIGEVFLTPRQLEALSVCASHPGVTTYQLADKLGIAHSTLRNLLSGAYQILNVENRTEAIVKARQMGLITPEVPGI